MPLLYGRSIARSLPTLGVQCSARPQLLSIRSPQCPRSRAPCAPLRSFARRRFATNKLDLPNLDEKWRRKWEELGSDSNSRANGSKGSQYILPMFPYPSGTLHVGHLRVYTIADVLARFSSLQGHNVLLPMGWDAFGLPAENAAIERGVNPATWTKDNIAKMKVQLDKMNGSWNWSNEIATCDPEFYKHTQKIFLLLQEKGLAYQAEAEVNYDPVDKTVLANEQVDAQGYSWRSGAKVEKRRLKQWFLRISSFREDLLEALNKLEEGGDWPERVLAMQKNWLGKSSGAMIKFPVMAFKHEVGAAIEVFTTRPDTLFGVQYLALAATHPTVASLAKEDPELQAFLDTLPGLPPDSKVGYLLPHIRAINPLAYHEDTPEATKESIPVYVASYVLGDYGEGAVMGVPGHDPRDFAFWKEHHYDEPIRVVLAASEDESTTAMLNEPYVDHGIMTEHGGPFKGRASKEAGQMLVSMLEAAQLAKPIEKWRLRDWLISRQRYWGTPIPIIHCDSCGAVPVPDDRLPVELPAVDSHWAEGKTGNPLESLHNWVNTPCPKCGDAAKRDTDTMDTFVDSSWYFMRFVDPHNKDAPFSAEKVRELLPVDIYIGGIEHAILHLLYARFIYKFLMTSSLVSDGSGQSSLPLEPFRRLVTQGMVQGKTYTNPSNGKFLKPDEVDLSDSANPKVAKTGEVAHVSFEKMSKSKHNGVDPTKFIAEYGADPTRAHLIFQAPVGDQLNWDAEKISGVTRWLHKVYDLVLKTKESPACQTTKSAKEYLEEGAAKLGSSGGAELSQWDADAAVWLDVQRTIESVTSSYRKVTSLNTVVSDLMSLTNTIAANGNASPIIQKEAIVALLSMAAPITPAFAEECWSILNPTPKSIFRSVLFPVPDGTTAILQPRMQACAVQVNGKLRLVVDIPKPLGLRGDELKDWVIDQITKTDEGKAKLLDGATNIRSAKKVLVVKEGKLVNFVL